MKTKFNLIITVGLFSASLLSYAQTNNKYDKDRKNDGNHKNDMVLVEKVDKDYQFVVDAAESSMLEIQLGELAQTNGSSSLVKEFGKTMVDDHTKVKAELKNLAEKKKFVIATKLGDKCQKKYNDLSQKKGADFDKEYMDMMVKGHKDAIDKFEDESKDGKDAGIKSWASSKISTLKHHLQMAESTKDVVKK